MGRKRIGRPRLNRGDARGAVVTVRLLRSERLAIGRAAKAAGTGVSAWIRTVLLSATNPVTIQNGKTEGEGIEP
jgi:hypothetical protein